MKKYLPLLLISIFAVIVPLNTVQAEDGAAALKRIGLEVAELNLGFDGYVLGDKLTGEQQALARKNRVEKTVDGTIKFQDGNTFIVAKEDDLMVLGIYREYPKIAHEQIKEIIGELMLHFYEPTTAAHDKIIYWAFGKNGKISQEEFNSAKQDGETDIIATVKFQANEAILTSLAPVEDKNEESTKLADAYVIISSNPLSKIFLAQNK